ncbi:MAG: chemotaxis-specific protein-glutamate methyltransferase CheB [Mariprofundaceae bacterium]
MNKLKIIVVDGDMRARMALAAMLNAEENLKVVGVAADPMLARMMIKSRKPDLVTTCIDMKNMDGFAFIADVMKTQPVPMVVISSQMQPGSEAKLRALKLGAAATLAKPEGGIHRDDCQFSRQLLGVVQATANRLKRPAQANSSATTVAAKAVPAPSMGRCTVMDTLVVMGASTGGTEALRNVISKYPANFPAVLIVQHLPTAFTAPFVAKLNQASTMNVVEATDGMEIHKGHVYVAPGHGHMRIEKSGLHYVCRIDGTDKISGHCPSVDALFQSVSQHVGSKAVGVLMTGMGADGAAGLKKMRDGGAQTIAQDKESSVVWGMPGAAVKLGAAQHQVHLDGISVKVMQLLGR